MANESDGEAFNLQIPEENASAPSTDANICDSGTIKIEPDANDSYHYETSPPSVTNSDTDGVKIEPQASASSVYPYWNTPPPRASDELIISDTVDLEDESTMSSLCLPHNQETLYKNKPGSHDTLIREEDPLDLFFRSIAMSVKQLKPELIREAKMRMLQTLCELESRNDM